MSELHSKHIELLRGLAMKFLNWDDFATGDYHSGMRDAYESAGERLNELIDEIDAETSHV